jgi:CRP/FNR family putative post-exponential-phase nitrogen-starvation transcriptional regulator
MEYINNEKLLKKYLEQEKISEKFGSRELPFRLVRFEKGELLTSSGKRLDNLLFIARGDVRIYGISDDGRMSSVTAVGEHAMLGDAEFSRGKPSLFMTEALSEVICIAINIRDNLSALLEDACFLRFLNATLADKLEAFSRMEISMPTLEEKLLFYLKEVNPRHEVPGVERCTAELHCSRRQLQRVLKKLCDSGELIKTSKGHYRSLCDSH